MRYVDTCTCVCVVMHNKLYAVLLEYLMEYLFVALGKSVQKCLFIIDVGKPL